MRTSSVFKTMMLYEVCPHWHRDMNMKELYLIINKYNKYVEDMPTNLKHRRVYLPKLIDPVTGIITKYRPLGVPTLAWRIYLHTWQFFLMIFLQHRIPSFQHGFYKGRGTKTAWEEVLLKTINAKNIYEFDFEQFFPSVNASMLESLLHRKGMPKEISNYLMDLNLSYPNVKTLDETKLDETNSLYKAELDHIGLLHTKFKEEFSVPNFVLNQTSETPDWKDDEVVKSHLTTLLDLDIMMINFGIEINQNLDNYLEIIYNDRTDNLSVQEAIKSIMESRTEGPVSTSFKPGETKSENLSYESFMTDYSGKVLKPIQEFIRANTTEGYWSAKVNAIESWLNDESVVKRLRILFKDSPEELQNLVNPSKEQSIDKLLLELSERNFKVEPNYKQSVLRTIMEGRINRATIHKTLTSEQTWNPGIDGKDLLISLMMEDLGYTREDILSHWYETCYEYLQVQSALFESFKPNVYKGSALTVDKPLSGDSTTGTEPGFKTITEEQVKGLPQGSPISPLLSSFLLAEVNEMTTESSEHAPDWIFYADDGLIYSNWDSSDMEKYINTFVVPKYEQWGIKFNLSKSGWIKQDGEWQKPLKFVGLTYDPFQESKEGTKGILRASTKKGATLIFDQERALMDYSLQLDPHQNSEQISEAIFYDCTRDLGEVRRLNRTWQEFKRFISSHSLEWSSNNITSIIARITKELKLKYSTLIESGHDYLSKVNGLINKTLSLYDQDIKISLDCNFQWNQIIETNCFGYILARLYCDSWGQSIKQDFTMKFKSESWCWYASNHKYNPLAVMTFYGGLTRDDFERFSSTKFIYGHGDSRYDEFTPLSKEDFTLIRLMERRPISEFIKFMGKLLPFESELEGLLRIEPRTLIVKSYPVDPVSGESFQGPPLTVFNSSSYSLPFLVRLFDFQYELSYWREEMSELGLSKKLQKQILGLMRLGYDGTKLLSPFQKFFYSSPLSHMFSSNDDFSQWRSDRSRDKSLWRNKSQGVASKYGIIPSLLNPLDYFIESWSSYEHQKFEKSNPEDITGDSSVIYPFD